MFKLRRYLLILTLILVSIGLVMIFSASAIYSNKYLDDSAYFLKRHFLYLLIGILAGACVMAVDYKFLQKISKPLIILSFILLVLVLIPSLGREISGAKRWFRVGGVSFQPSEFAEICLIIYAADFLSRKVKTGGKNILHFLPLLMVLGAALLLILIQPDLGTSFSIATIVSIMIFYAGINLKYIFWGLLASLPILSWAIFSVPYRRMRVTAFLNPWLDPQGSGFQLIQSQIALGTGGIFGVGLGQSKQKLFYLPAAHTDFIFSIISEELGLIGSLVIIGLFVMFTLLVLKIIKNCQDTFGRFLALGLISMIVLKAAINICVCSGMMPTKGLPLPFISYGGTSFVMDLIAVGLILNISARSEPSIG